MLKRGPLLVLAAAAPLLLLYSASAEARVRGGVAAAPPAVPGCPLGTGKTDLNGEPDDCADATQNPSFQDVNFFTTARQSGQTYNAALLSSLNYNKSGIDNGTGYNIQLAVRDPATVSFDATTASITAGVLYVDVATLGDGGVPYVGQWLVGTGITAKTVKITGNIDATHWQTDAPGLTLGTRAISGRLYTGVNCQFLHTSVTYAAPRVNCPTTSDWVTENDFTGFDMSMYGGVVLRIVLGEASGKAGPIIVRHNKFTCNAEPGGGGGGGFISEPGTHHDTYFEHNGINGGFTDGCTLYGATYSNSTTGISASDLRVHSFKWNDLYNAPVHAAAGLLGFVTHDIEHNTFRGFNLSGSSHGAVFANTQSLYLERHKYKQNICLYPATSFSGTGTTCFSFLGDASNHDDAIIGNAVVSGNIAINNLAVLDGAAVTQNCLMANNDPVAYGTLSIGGNLVDRTGCAGGTYQGGRSRSIMTASIAPNVGTGTSTVTVTDMDGDNWQQNAFVHVNGTPFVWCAAIVYNGDGATGTMTLNTTAPCPSAPAIDVNTAVAGILVPPGIYISAKTSATVFTVKNANCSLTASCTADKFTVALSGLYQAFSVMPLDSIDPATGLPQTGNGKGPGTYIVNSEGGAYSSSTWRRFNPAITSFPPDVNNGNDYDLVSGDPLYMSGSDW